MRRWRRNLLVLRTLETGVEVRGEWRIPVAVVVLKQHMRRVHTGYSRVIQCYLLHRFSESLGLTLQPDRHIGEVIVPILREISLLLQLEVLCVLLEMGELLLVVQLGLRSLHFVGR